MTHRPPSFAPIVVIGDGVMGCSVLHQLAKEGVGDAILVRTKSDFIRHYPALGGTSAGVRLVCYTAAQ